MQAQNFYDMRKTFLTFLILFICSVALRSQEVEIIVAGSSAKASFSKLSGEKVEFLDSIPSFNAIYSINSARFKLSTGFYRLHFGNNRWLDFVYNNENIVIETNLSNIIDSMKIVFSESNKLFQQFAKLNKAFRAKSELLQVILLRYPKDDIYYAITHQRLTEIQNEYLEFVNKTSQRDPNLFIARYIRSSQLPVVDMLLPFDAQLQFLKTHSLDNVDFNDEELVNSDAFSNKAIEYLTYYRNPQFPLELLEKEFITSVDSILKKARVNQKVYQHLTEYLIDGFKKFGFDRVLDYIVENYVIKDDLCLDIKTEEMIEKRIQQARVFKIGSKVPDIVSLNQKGNSVQLSKLKFEKCLIVFYLSSCPHCKELLPQLNELQKANSKKRVEILAISLDSKKEEWIDFVNQYCSSLNNISDLQGWEGKSAKSYFIFATPTMFLVDSNLKLLSKPTSIDEVKSAL